MQSILFDRFVDITLDYADTINVYSSTVNRSGTVKIVTPKTGRKPDIQVSGSVLQSPVISTMNVKIINFTSSVPLGSFTKITVEAGYRNGVKTAVTGAVNAGAVGWAYQESPSPDGITNFTLMLGDFVTWTNAVGEFNTTPGITYKVTDIFQYFCDRMKFTPVFGPGIETLVWNAELKFIGQIKDLLTMIATEMRFVIRVEGTSVLCYFQKRGLYAPYNAKKISFLSSPPRKETPATISFVAPWRPDLRPGDVISIDPKYAKYTFSGSLTSSAEDSLYTVNTLEFDFSTTSGQNMMKVEGLKYVADSLGE